MSRDNIYKREYDEAKIKFDILHNHKDGNMIFQLLDKSITRWNSPEWGIPKGRRKVWFPNKFNMNKNLGYNGINYSNNNIEIITINK